MEGKVSKERNREQAPHMAMVSLHRITGQKNLFGVDWPQGHFIRLEVHEGSVERDLSTDWYHEGRIVLSLDMSEVQFARLITSLNVGGGVPATFAYRPDPEAKLLAVEAPVAAKSKTDTFKGEVARTAVKASAALKEAIVAADNAMAGKTVTKGQLLGVLELMRTAAREMEANLPFVVDMAKEAISDAADRGKAEVEAFAGHVSLVVGGAALRGEPLDQVAATVRGLISPPAGEGGDAA
jgi:hypothetical protein